MICIFILSRANFRNELLKHPKHFTLLQANIIALHILEIHSPFFVVVALESR